MTEQQSFREDLGVFYYQASLCCLDFLKTIVENLSKAYIDNTKLT